MRSLCQPSSKSEAIQEWTDKNGIFLSLMQHGQALKKRGYFNIPEPIEHNIDAFEKENNHVKRFRDECLKYDANASVTIKKRNDRYIRFCKQNNIQPLGLNLLTKQVEVIARQEGHTLRYGNKQINKKAERSIFGLAFLDTDE